MRDRSVYLLALLVGCAEPPAVTDLDASLSAREGETPERVLAWDARQRDLGGLDADDLEHEIVIQDSVFVEVVGLEDGGERELRAASVDVRFVNTTETDQVLRTATFGDRGDLQSRRRHRTADVTVPARDVVEMPISLVPFLARRQTNSGMFTVGYEACPSTSAAADCQYGAMDPVYLHLDPTGTRVWLYDQATMCARYGCGDLTGRVPVEAGTTRVMGGGPERALTTREEPEEEEPAAFPTGDDLDPRPGDPSTGDPGTGDPTDPTSNPTDPTGGAR